ncbi:MAG TPA: Holliday junction branch migration DNA helicase RuvB [Haliangiales bacterium]|nr:Holliday junction branch migration DNA helicase RuvB [Haliangiales bacterium]
MMARKKHEERGELSPETQPEERELDVALRPKRFAEYLGQRALVDNLKVFVQAARRRGEALDHMLFAGPPGLGKTTLAHVIAAEMGVKLHVTSGPAIDHKGVLAGLLTSVAEGDVLFIDEIHRLSPVVEENLYPAMEDFRIDVFIGDGPHARAMSMSLPRFTLLGATTRTGLLASPLLNRFGFVGTLSYYDVDELTSIVRRSARLLEVDIDDEGASEIGCRARGTPRIGNRLLRRVRDFAEVEGDGTITRAIADFALRRLQVDPLGLDAQDLAYLRVMLERFDGGPVGIEALSASVGEERSTLEDVVEPYLVKEGFVARTPRGRIATGKAYLHLGVKRTRSQESLL